jgi:hypothetical protein
VAETVLLDPQHIEFVEGGVAIRIATRDGFNRPSVAVGLGCRVAPDRWHITLYLAAVPGRRVIDGLRQSGSIAVYFHQAATNRAIQIKGRMISIDRTPESARPLLVQYMDRFEAAVAAAGFSPELVRIGMGYPLDQILTVTFIPEAAFSQSPGPQAGTPLE